VAIAAQLGKASQGDFELWKYFSDRADGLKDKLWTFVTWLLGLMGVLLGFLTDTSTRLTSFGSDGLTVSSAWPALVLSVVGVLLCLLTLMIIVDYGQHIERNWDRAGRVVKRITGLKQILDGEDSTQETKPGEKDKNGSHVKSIRLPKYCWFLLIIDVGFLLVFLTIASLAARHVGG
jgi:hypothetical protein